MVETGFCVHRMWRYSLFVLHFVSARSRHTVRLLVHVIVVVVVVFKSNSHIIGIAMTSSYVGLKIHWNRLKNSET